MDKKEQILQRLIKEHSIKSPKADFTNNVMQQLQEEWIHDDTVLPVKPLNSPSSDFTSTIMGKVETLDKRVHKPIINKSFIAVYFAIITVLAIIGIYIKDSKNNTTKLIYNLSEFYNIAVINLRENVNTLALLLIPICILLFLEYIYKKYIVTRKIAF
ncbi:MAG: hypothetical protein BM557_09135 [Flavobacterium sp. MedPE-SWcel]|uniref:hypothetical protein n=1 Tax=uncultured Flavobacterium sp. TaxID=165435 RepID=UPI00091876A8|nr:hypothetical protein [uncultured Flavobacterium sp.]OIQ16903.1 MAG: hypothetical protein BM557_09135 [Flavobacterium sp. MedPE-SWcel]